MMGRTSIVVASLLCVCELSASAAERLPVLFLGDRGHHRPADRAAQLLPVMAGRGIDITYTEDPADLNPAHLARFKAVLLYANIGSLADAQEQALLDYIAAGGGFVPVHCASACCGKSDRFVALVGAAFARHGAGVFDTVVVDPDHPVTKGLELFSTWDETYVHSRHNEAARQVLQVRREAGKDEPWTWVRTHGKGRVFYTAYGHDGHTWGQPGFHALLERGIRWAAGTEVFDSNPRRPADCKPFEYVEANIPFYPAGKTRSAVENSARAMQKPLDPAESAKHLLVPPGFRAELLAAEPQIKKPIAMNWDHRGRLWIAETIDYPNEMRPEGEGRDRLVICEDTDADGRMDKFTVFADKLSIPTSLCFAGGGVIVAQAPHLLFLADTDGDDKADVRKVLFTGWGTGDTHAGPSNLTYGFDGWIYGMVGYSGFRGEVGGETHRFGQGFFRFTPDGGKLEFLRSTSNNSWGVGFSEDGLLFGSTANGNPSVYLPIPNRYYERVRGWSSAVLGMTAENTRFYPATDKVRQVDWHGQFTAAAGHALYTARAYPKEYWNRTAFVTEGTGHLVATFVIKPRGSDFVTMNTWNLLASDDEWTAPIVAEVGPDGCVWVIDWYNYIVQHNPTPPGFKTGKGNAYETDLRDKRHGRIYRVVPEGFRPPAAPRLDPADPASLIAGLRSDNLLWRRHAQRLLIERGRADVVEQLAALTRDASVDAAGLNTAAIHALWTLHGLGAAAGVPAAAEAAFAALRHPSAGVRRAALMTLPRDARSAEAVTAAGCLADRDAQVRLAAFLALSEMPRSRAVAEAVSAAIVRPENASDRWIPDAATAAAAAHDVEFLTAAAWKSPPPAAVIPVFARVAAHYARGAPTDSLPTLLAALPDTSAPVAAAIVGGLSAWPKDKPARLDADADRALARLFASLPAESQGTLAGLALRWGSAGFEKHAAEAAASLIGIVTDESAAADRRVAAARQLITFRRNDPAAAETVLAQITPRSPPELAVGLVSAAAGSEAPAVGKALTARLAGLTPAARGAALSALLSRTEWSKALLDAVEAGKARLDDLALDQKRSLSDHPDKDVAARARRLLAAGGGLPDADRQKVIEQLSPLVLSGGDPAKGKAVFKQHCATCHRHTGEGNNIGPDLSGMAVHTREHLLTDILDPGRNVESNFRQYVLRTDDGRVLAGLLASETKTAVELIDAQAQRQTVLRENIEELLVSSKSMMPEGFEKQIPAASLADLLAFLTQRGRFLPLDLRKAATITSVKGMFYGEDAKAERLVFPDWGPKTFAGVPFQLVDPQDGKAANVILLHSRNGKLPPNMPKSVSLDVAGPAKAVHLLGGVAGWGSPYGGKGTVSMTVRLHFADGKTEDHALINGEHVADYIRRVDVPGSQHAFDLAGRQVRYLAIRPGRPDALKRIEFVKGRDDTAPVVVAVTVESPE